MTTSTTLPAGAIRLGADFAQNLLRALPRLLAEGAMPEDWDPRATTYDLMRFDSDEAFAQRFEQALGELVSGPLEGPQLRERLAAVGLPFDYARLGQPLATLVELYLQARTQAARCFSFASVTKPWLAVIEAPGRVLPVHIYAEASLPISPAKAAALRAEGVELFENWRAPLPAPNPKVLTVLVAEKAFDGDVRSLAADAVCFALPAAGPAAGGILLIRDTARIEPRSIQLIRKRTVASLLAADARAELSRVAGQPVPVLDEATPATCDTKLRALFPQLKESLYFCTGLAAEAAVFSAAAEVLGPKPVALFYAQNGYGGTGQLISELLSRGGAITPRPLAVFGSDASGRKLTLVDRVLAGLEELKGAPACVFLETPTNPELQAHDFDTLMNGLRADAQRWDRKVPIIVDTTLAPLFPIFAKSFSAGWPFILVKSGSKYFTKGKATLGVAACADEPVALAILRRARELATDADSFARPHQLAQLSAGLEDLPARMKAISAHTIRLASGLREALRSRGHEITLYAITESQVAEGLGTGMLSFYLPPASTTHADLCDEFVDYLLKNAPSLVKSRVSYGQSTGNGQPDYFYVINPEESTQGALSAEVKNAQKQNNVQICRISVPELANVDGLLSAMDGFFTLKYGPKRSQA
jgi:cystathionine beta-lyase/cystathionine gamma-synthase